MYLEFTAEAWLEKQNGRRPPTGPVPPLACAEDGRFLGVVSRTTLMRFLDRTTPPVPPPQTERAPLHLNPAFPHAASEPVVSAPLSSSAGARP